MKNQVSRYRNYLEVIGKRTAVSVSTLASASGLPTEKVRDDLTEMLNQGILPAGCLDDRIGRT
jgi:predicted transcriptional regulator